MPEPEVATVDTSGSFGRVMADTIGKELPGAIAESKAQGAEMRRLGTETADRLERGQKKAEGLAAPPLPPPNPPPEMKNSNPTEAWGSTAMGLAMLGSAFTRRPAINALNAAAGVMKAYQARDADEYKRNFERWKAENDYSLKMYEYQRDAYKDALDLIGKDNQTALAILRTRMAAFNDPFKPLADAGRLAELEAGLREREARIPKLREDSKHAEAVAGARNAELDAFDALKKAEASGDQGAIAQARQQFSDAQARAKIVMQTPSAGIADQRLTQENELFDRLKQEWQADPKNQGKPFSATIEAEMRAQAHGAVQGRSQAAMSGTLSEESANLLADQFILGDTQAITSLPRSGPARVKVENRIAEKMREMPDAARHIAMNRMRMAEARSAATTAGRITMNTELFATEAVDAGKELVRASEAFPRTEYPLVNQALQAYETNTGDPRIIRFGVALNALRNAYGKMSNPTGTGVHDADKAAFEKILNTALSQGQIESGVNQIVTEGRIMSNAAQKAQEEVLGRIIPTTQGAAPAAPTAPAPSPAASPTAAAPPPAQATGVPAGLPDPKGVAEGSTAKDKTGKVVAVIRNGQWVAP